MRWKPLVYCSLSCVCGHRLLVDRRIPMLTRNNFVAGVRWFR